MGQLEDDTGMPIAIPGLWALTFGNDHLGGAANTLFFAAGIQNETHGLFGAIQSPAGRGADTAGPGAFDPNAPGEAKDYPLPPTVGLRLQSDADRPVAIATLQPIVPGSLLLAPTLTLAAAPSTAATTTLYAGTPPASSGATLFVSTASITTPTADVAALPFSSEEPMLDLNAFLNVNLSPQLAQERVPTTAPAGPLLSSRASIANDSTAVAFGAILGIDRVLEEQTTPSPSAWSNFLRNLAAVAALPLLWGYWQADRRKTSNLAEATVSKLPRIVPLPIR
jgi:hypothetical protein